MRRYPRSSLMCQCAQYQFSRVTRGCSDWHVDGGCGFCFDILTALGMHGSAATTYVYEPRKRKKDRPMNSYVRQYRTYVERDAAMLQCAGITLQPAL